MCQYMDASPQIKDKVLSQTWFPFELSKASKQGEVYVAPGELEFRYGLGEDDRVVVFLDKPA